MISPASFSPNWPNSLNSLAQPKFASLQPGSLVDVVLQHNAMQCEALWGNQTQSARQSVSQSNHFASFYFTVVRCKYIRSLPVFCGVLRGVQRYLHFGFGRGFWYYLSTALFAPHFLPFPPNMRLLIAMPVF